MEFQDVAVVDVVITANGLPIVPVDTPSAGELQIRGEIAMQLHGGIYYRAADREHKRIVVIDTFAGGFGVHSQDVQPVVNGFLQVFAPLPGGGGQRINLKGFAVKFSSKYPTDQRRSGRLSGSRQLEPVCLNRHRQRNRSRLLRRHEPPGKSQF